MENFILIDTIWQLELSELKLSVLYNFDGNFNSLTTEEVFII